jgi:hypothetical protein
MNSDDFYFQRADIAKDQSVLQLVMGDNWGTAPFYPTPVNGSTTDAFEIGALHYPDETWHPLFTFTGNGSLGVGTTTPQSMLDVNGTANFTGNITAAGLSFGDYGPWGGVDGNRQWMAICANSSCGGVGGGPANGQYMHISGATNPSYSTSSSAGDSTRVLGLFDTVIIPGGSLGVGSWSPPLGTLDVENGTNNATLCLNGSCTQGWINVPLTDANPYDTNCRYKFHGTDTDPSAGARGSGLSSASGVDDVFYATIVNVNSISYVAHFANAYIPASDKGHYYVTPFDESAGGTIFPYITITKMEKRCGD